MGRGEAQATSLLNVSYDPTRELYREFDAAFNEHWQAEGHAGARHPDLARRLGRAGARGDRRPRRAGGDAGARQRHRRHRREDRQDPGRLAEQAAAQLRALHLDDRLPGARGQPEGHRGLGRPRRATTSQVITPNPKTSGGARWNYLAAWAYADKKFGGDQDADPGLRARALRQRPGARHRRPRLDHDLRPARHRRRAARLGERGLPRARRNSATTSSRSCCPSISILAEPTVALVEGNIASPEQGEAAQGLPRLPLQPRGAGDRAQELLPRLGHQRRPTRPTSRASRSSTSSRSTTSAAGRRCSPSTSATAASSTRSTPRSSGDARARLPPPVAAAGLPARLRDHDDDALARRPDPDRRPDPAGRRHRPGRALARDQHRAGLGGAAAVLRHRARSPRSSTSSSAWRSPGC